MHIEKMPNVVNGEIDHGMAGVCGLVRWTSGSSFADIADEIREKRLQSLAFVDTEFFADRTVALAMCRDMRERAVNVLWSASLEHMPMRELLHEMRMAGCQSIAMRLVPDEAIEALSMAREFGFEVRLRNVDDTPYAADRISYTVAEREAIVERLPGLHAAQFDLAVAYYKARRFSDVMLPLGKAMTMGFPMNELCLNLLACLSAAKHYPDMAAGLLDQARYGCPHPVVFRNRKLLQSWLESGGDLKGVRLVLEPDGGPSMSYHT